MKNSKRLLDIEYITSLFYEPHFFPLSIINGLERMGVDLLWMRDRICFNLPSRPTFTCLVYTRETEWKVSTCDTHTIRLIFKHKFLSLLLRLPSVPIIMWEKHFSCWNIVTTRVLIIAKKQPELVSSHHYKSIHSQRTAPDHIQLSEY